MTPVAQKAKVNVKCDRCGRTKSIQHFYLKSDKLSPQPGCKLCRTKGNEHRRKVLRENGVQNPITMEKAGQILGLSPRDAESLIRQSPYPLVNVAAGGKRKICIRADRLHVETLAFGMTEVKQDDETPQESAHDVVTPPPTNQEGVSSVELEVTMARLDGVIAMLADQRERVQVENHLHALKLQVRKVCLR